MPPPQNLPSTTPTSKCVNILHSCGMAHLSKPLEKYLPLFLSDKFSSNQVLSEFGLKTAPEGIVEFNNWDSFYKI